MEVGAHPWSVGAHPQFIADKYAGILECRSFASRNCSHCIATDRGWSTHFNDPVLTQAARTLDVCRVMLVPRAAYDSIARDFLIGAQQVLSNLLTRCDERVRREVRSGSQQREDTVSAIQHGSYLRQQQVGLREGVRDRPS